MHRRALLLGLSAFAFVPTVPRHVVAAFLPELPVPLREVVVRTGSELASALAGAAPGDHVVLEDGDYSGYYEMRRSGTPDHPIVIRARNLLGARIGIRGISFPDASVHDVMVWGIDFKDCADMHLNGRRIVFRRCRIWPKFDPDGSFGVRMENCSDCRFDYCTLRLYTTDEVRAMGAQDVFQNSPWHDRASYGCLWSYTSPWWFENGRYPRRITVERCRFEGGPAGVPYNAPNCQFVEWGGHPGYTNRLDPATNEPAYPMDNVIRLCSGRVARDRTIVDIKGVRCTLDRLHIVGPGNGAVQIREGLAHTIRRCRFEGGVYMEVESAFHHIRDVAGPVWLMAGTRRWSDPVLTDADMGAWRACEHTQVHNCPATVLVGHAYAGMTVPARHITLANCPDHSLRLAENVSILPSSPHPPEPPPLLHPSQTGHDAPWVGVEG